MARVLGESVIILHPYSDVRVDEQQETWDAIQALSTIEEFTIHSRRCGSDQDSPDYWKFLSEHWSGRYPFIIVEQDIAPRVGHVIDLATCQEDSCAIPYVLLGNTPSVFEFMAVGKPPIPTSWPPPRYTYGSGFGLTKIGPAVQNAVDLSDYPVAEYGWTIIDTWVSERMHEKGLQWHVHPGLVKHVRLDPAYMGTG